MRILITLIFFLNASLAAVSQIIVPTCVDSLNVNPYFPCAEDYNPVCGCDGKTYRNECSAIHKGGIVNGNYQAGICDNFDFDFVPNPVDRDPGKFSLYVKVLPAYADVFVYDIFGKVKYYQGISVYDNLVLHRFDINMSGNQRGVYCLIVVVNGEQKSLKFIYAGNE